MWTFGPRFGPVAASATPWGCCVQSFARQGGIKVGSKIHFPFSCTMEISANHGDAETRSFLQLFPARLFSSSRVSDPDELLTAGLTGNMKTCGPPFGHSFLQSLQPHIHPHKGPFCLPGVGQLGEASLGGLGDASTSAACHNGSDYAFHGCQRNSLQAGRRNKREGE
jgi:hypothetical protein